MPTIEDVPNLDDAVDSEMIFVTVALSADVLRRLLAVSKGCSYSADAVIQDVLDEALLPGDVNVRVLSIT